MIPMSKTCSEKPSPFYLYWSTSSTNTDQHPIKVFCAPFPQLDPPARRWWSTSPRPQQGARVINVNVSSFRSNSLRCSYNGFESMIFKGSSRNVAPSIVVQGLRSSRCAQVVVASSSHKNPAIILRQFRMVWKVMGCSTKMGMAIHSNRHPSTQC